MAVNRGCSRRQNTRQIPSLSIQHPSAASPLPVRETRVGEPTEDGRGSPTLLVLATTLDADGRQHVPQAAVGR
jgi:hypothetical protein